jgi:integrase
MATLRAKISKRSVDAIEKPAEGETWLWDTELKGFFLRVYATGRKVYAVKCRAAGRQRIHTIGVHSDALTPEEARGEAEEALRRARKGEDPNAEKKAAREALTVAELIDRYLSDGPGTKPAKRASTWAIDASNLNRHIRPLLGSKIANAVTKAEAARAVRDIESGKTAKDEKTKARGRARVTGGAGTSRRTRITAAAMFAWGAEHGITTGNPFKGVKLAAAPVRERFLSKAEAGDLLDAIAELQAEKGISDAFADALRLLLLTGARKTEILGLRWSEVDFERKQLTLPPERTKAGGATGERRIVLSPPALAILAERRATVEKARAKAKAAGETFAEPQFILPATRGDGHAIGLRRAFAKACSKAGLSGVRVHDLRHSFASFAVADGASLFLIGKLLGHASARTTERYAHLSGDPLQDAAAMIGRRIMGGFTPEDSEGEGAKPSSVAGFTQRA